MNLMERINCVDMGNGILWATGNITKDADGNYKIADNPEDYGCYFSWGDIIGHSPNDGYVFNEDNYNKGLSGDGHNLTPYIPSGDPTYDAATATLGKNWRMPTYDEFRWLVDNCNPTWVTRNGVNGELFTNPNDSSKTLFFPAAGSYYEGVTSDGGGINGMYWSTKLYSRLFAYYLEFDKMMDYGMYYYGGNRNYGFSVRPVMDIND